MAPLWAIGLSLIPACLAVRGIGGEKPLDMEHEPPTRHTAPVFSGDQHVFMAHHTTPELSFATYVITLRERRRHVETFLRDLGLSNVAHIQPAVLKSRLDLHSLVAHGHVKKQAGLSMGEIACSLSHREVLKHFLQTNKTHVLVFEDDARVGSGIEKELQTERGANFTMVQFFEELAQTSEKLGWHGLNLGRCWDHCDEDHAVMKVSEQIDVVKSKRSLCTYGYLFTREGAKIHLKSTGRLRDAEDRVRMSFPNFVYMSTRPRLLEQAVHKTNSINGEKFHPECK
uniref:Glycosyl transferase family 25 domain-containing protein n=1 Tax=Lotharella oceanica TaxID=641309 RepID=A0A7S2XJH5_9EUKA|eukprot:CAMPEP_0170168592 /NCGR_PEP_ID=MMETSP0040_2-20121228/1568_1 /TAXON_ID=641309 /ORGANISM="Lotharella oceanica, Strain CCMP622" /LENGTH=284 /DNA_ID=CAMNT_0010406867 /DNA_START=73 /DNA_END=927 /DNA_ORIENTATION=+